MRLTCSSCAKDITPFSDAWGTSRTICPASRCPLSVPSSYRREPPGAGWERAGRVAPAQEVPRPGPPHTQVRGAQERPAGAPGGRAAPPGRRSRRAVGGQGTAREEPSEAETSRTDPGSSVGAARSARGGCHRGLKRRALSGWGGQALPRTVFPTFEQTPRGRDCQARGVRPSLVTPSCPSLVWRRRKKEGGSQKQRGAGLGPTWRPSELISAQEEARAAAPALKSCSGRWAIASKSLTQDNCEH